MSFLERYGAAEFRFFTFWIVWFFVSMLSLSSRFYWKIQESCKIRIYGILQVRCFSTRKFQYCTIKQGGPIETGNCNASRFCQSKTVISGSYLRYYGIENFEWFSNVWFSAVWWCVLILSTGFSSGHCRLFYFKCQADDGSSGRIWFLAKIFNFNSQVPSWYSTTKRDQFYM